MKTQLPVILQEKNVPVLELDKDLNGISLLLKDKMAEEIGGYGILLDEFRVNTIRKPESDRFYRSLKHKKKECLLVKQSGPEGMKKEEALLYKPEEEVAEFEIRVKKLMKAKEAGLITEEQFELHKKKLLESI